MGTAIISPNQSKLLKDKARETPSGNIRGLAQRSKRWLGLAHPSEVAPHGLSVLQPHRGLLPQGKTTGKVGCNRGNPSRPVSCIYPTRFA